VDHKVSDLLARVILLLSQDCFCHESSFAGHELLQLAQTHCNLQLLRVEAQILRLGSAEHEFIHPLCGHLQCEHVIVDDCGLDVLSVDLLAECRATQYSLHLVGHVDQFAEPAPLVTYQQLHHDFLWHCALFVFGETDEVLLFERQLSEGFGHVFIVHLGLHFVEGLFQLVLKDFAHERLEHSKEVTSIPYGYSVLTVQTFFGREVYVSRE